MSNSLVVLLAAVAAAMPPLPVLAQAKTSPALDKVTSELAAAFNAEDAARASRLYAEEAVLMPADMPMVKGRTAIQAHFSKEFAATEMTLQLDPLESAIDGNQGFSFGTSTFTPKQGEASRSAAAAPPPQKGKYVLVFKRVGADWKIVYDIFNNDAPAPQAK